MSQLQDIKEHIFKSNIVERLIYLNIGIYIITLLFTGPMLHLFGLASAPTALMSKPWTLFSYAFLHRDFLHVFSNLLVLYYIGNMFLNFFSEKKFIIYYVMGLLIGGLVFVLFYFLKENTTGTLLIGASAGVMAIMVGLASKIPHYALKLRFIGSVELWVLAAIFVALSALGTAGVNAGAGVAHLGGALMGFLLTAYFNEGAFLVQKRNVKAKKRKTTFQHVYTNNSPIKTKKSHSKKKQNQQKVDAILDKISKSGYDALSKEEKDYLFNQKED